MFKFRCKNSLKKIKIPIKANREAKRFFVSILDTEEILHMYINRIIIPPRYKIIIKYINQLNLIERNLILITIDLIINIKQEINNEFDKDKKKLLPKK